jgi:hypothetical protein
VVDLNLGRYLCQIVSQEGNQSLISEGGSRTLNDTYSLL